MKNSAGRGGCYPQRPKAEVLFIQIIFSTQTCKDVNLLAAISLFDTTSSQGFLCLWFNNFDVNGSIICSGLHFRCYFDVNGSIICSGLHF